MRADYAFQCIRSLWIVWGKTARARKHLQASVDAEAQWWAGGLVVEPSYVADLAAGLREDGFRVTGDVL